MDEISEMTDRAAALERAQDELRQNMDDAFNQLVLQQPATRDLERLDSRPRSVGAASLPVRLAAEERELMRTPSRGGDASNRARLRRAAAENQVVRNLLNHRSARLAMTNPLHLISVRPGVPRPRFRHFTPMPNGPDPEHDALVDHLRGTVDEIDANAGQMFEEVLVRETRSKALKTIDELQESWKKNGSDLAKLEKIIRGYEELKESKKAPYEEMELDMNEAKEKAPKASATLRDFKHGVGYLNEVKEKYSKFEGFEKIVEAADHWKKLWEDAVEKAVGLGQVE